MNVLLDERDPQVIEEVSNALQVVPAVVEKDIYVTQVLHTLSDLENDYFRLIFHGGTCLSKAHRVIHRMSEDCDFKIDAKQTVKSLSKANYLRQLREFRRKIVELLEQAGFTINPENVRARNSG